jgi:hypothetical protein
LIQPCERGWRPNLNSPIITTATNEGHLRFEVSWIVATIQLIVVGWIRQRDGDMTAKLSLPDVTLLTVTSVKIDETQAALLHCAEQINFGAVKMFCSALPTTPDPRIHYFRIPPINILGYSCFMIENLNAYVDTGHCLIVQSDGFILDAAFWRDQFLDYDYIGAPWPERVAIMPPNSGWLQLGKNRVGNGGFSLRSKKFLEATSRIRYDTLSFPIMSEDMVICHHLYEDMLAAGIRFAPPELAARFSIESPQGLYGQSINSVFGFHGSIWLNALPGKLRPSPQPNLQRQNQGSHDIKIN